jgi:hypothetical protein
MDDRRKARIVVGRDLVEPTRLLGVRVAVGVCAADEPEHRGRLPLRAERSEIAYVDPVSRWCVGSKVARTRRAKTRRAGHPVVISAGRALMSLFPRCERFGQPATFGLYRSGTRKRAPVEPLCDAHRPALPEPRPSFICRSSPLQSDPQPIPVRSPVVRPNPSIDRSTGPSP